MNTTHILTIGSALVDIFIQSPNFVIDDEANALTCQVDGGKLEVEDFHVRTGGGGSNTAVGFARLGFAASCVAELGKDEFADLVKADLIAGQVSVEQLIQEKREQTGGSVILVTPSGQRLVLVHRGAASMLGPEDIRESAFEAKNWLHLSSISGQAPTLEKIFGEVEKRQIPMSWNPGKGEITLLVKESLPIPAQCQILFVNQEEWEMLFSRQEQLLQQVAQIVVTDSERGGRVYQHGSVAHTYTATPVTAIDNTGAGDAFAVGYVAAQLRYPGDVARACQWGAANAASVVQQIGAKPGLLSSSAFD